MKDILSNNLTVIEHLRSINLNKCDVADQMSISRQSLDNKLHERTAFTTIEAALFMKITGLVIETIGNRIQIIKL